MSLSSVVAAQSVTPVSPHRTASKQFHSEVSAQARLYYQTPSSSSAHPSVTQTATKEAERVRREQRLQRDLAQQTQEKILGNYLAHHAANSNNAGSNFIPDIKENPSSPIARRAVGGTNYSYQRHGSSDYTDIQPDTFVYRAPRDYQYSPSRSPKVSRCIIPSCPYESVGGRGFCPGHAATATATAAATSAITANEPSASPASPIRVVTRNGVGIGGRALSPNRATPATPSSFNHMTMPTSMGPSNHGAGSAATSTGVNSSMFPSIPSTPSRGSISNVTPLDEVSSFIHGHGSFGASSSSASAGTPIKLSSGRMSGPLLSFVNPNGAPSSSSINFADDTQLKVLTPRTASSTTSTASKFLSLQPTPPPTNQSPSHTIPPSPPQPIRPLRTPAGLALSYEHGRNMKGIRKEVLYKHNTHGASDTTTQLTSMSALSGSSLITHVHQTPLQPLNLPSSSSSSSAVSSLPPSSLSNLAQPVTLTSGLNRVGVGSPVQLRTGGPSATSVSVSGAGAASVPSGKLSSDHHATGPLLQPLLLHAAPTPTPTTTIVASSSIHTAHASSSDKPMTAVQRQRAYRAALLTKALAKPASVQTLDRGRLDNLKQLLDKRSSLFELQQRQVLLTHESFERSKEAREDARANLASLLTRRPSALALTSKNILQDETTRHERASTRGKLGNFMLRRPSQADVASLIAPTSGRSLLLQTLTEPTVIEESEDPIEEEEREQQRAKEAKATKQKTKGAGASADDGGGEHDDTDDDDDESADGDTVTSLARVTPEPDRFKKFRHLRDTLPQRRPSVALAPGQRKFSIFTSPKMVDHASATLNKLSNFLETRPHYDELMKRNIMLTKPGSNLAANPHLAAHARKMSFSNLRNNVSKLLQTRPTMKDLKNMAKHLLGTMVRGQMDEIRENEAEELAAKAEEAAAAAAGSIGDGSDSGSIVASVATPTDPTASATSNPGISLESLASDNLKIDEILAQKRRVLAQKLRLRAKEAEDVGGIYMSGGNDHGQTGFSGEQAFVPMLTHIPSLLRETIVQVACGFEHTLVRTLTGLCFSYGKNSYGQLGLQDTSDRDQPFSIHFRGSPLFKRTAVFIAAYEKTSALVTSDGELFTWGSIVTGALGHGNPNNEDPTVLPLNTTLPTIVPELKRVQKVSLGGHHGAALDTAGRLYTWGRNDSGALGNGDFKSKFRPSLIQNYGEFFSDVACGELHTVAIGFDNNVYTWGSNRSVEERQIGR